MYKNQLQELAQRSCFNLPSYSCIREGPDHVPRFKAKVSFNGEVFESPTFCSTLRQAEHAAAEVALKTFSIRGPSRMLAARVLDETGVYKNLLQETAHRAGLKLPVYTTVRSGPGHVPVFTCTVELGGMSFIGEPARTKKQAQKSTAMTAWFALKNLSLSGSSSSPLSEFGGKDEQEQVTVARYLASLQSAETIKLIQRDRLHERLELAPLRREVISYQAGRSFYPIQRQCRDYTHFSPELATYHAQPQERVFEQQSCLLALPSAPTCVPGPQFFPLVRSIIRPDHGPYFLTKGQEPVPVPGISSFSYFPDHSMPVPVRSMSQVTIKEIDDNTLVEEDWLSNNANSSGWKLNFLSNATGLSPTESLTLSNNANSSDSLNTHSRPRIQMLLHGNDEKNSESASTRNSSQKDIYRKEEFSRTPPGFIRHRPRATSTDEEIFCTQNPNSSSLVWSNVRPLNPLMDSSPRFARGFAPPLSAAPVAVRNARTNARAETPNSLVSRTPARTAVPVGSTRPWLEGAKNIRGLPCASTMAPAVQIRTVVPVCSAPPARKMAGPSQDRILSTGGRKMAEERGDIPAASSDMMRTWLHGA